MFFSIKKQNLMLEVDKKLCIKYINYHQIITLVLFYLFILELHFTVLGGSCRDGVGIPACKAYTITL